MSEAEDKAWQKHKTAWPLEAGVEPMNHEFAFRMGHRAAQAVSLPDRGHMRRVITVAADTNRIWLHDREGQILADAVLAALSTQPAAGEVEITDEQIEAAAREIDHRAFDLTRNRYEIETDNRWEGAQEFARESARTLARRVLEAARGVQPEAQPTELAELFPGTLAALDHLSIRPEVQ